MQVDAPWRCNLVRQLEDADRTLYRALVSAARANYVMLRGELRAMRNTIEQQNHRLAAMEQCRWLKWRSVVQPSDRGRSADCDAADAACCQTCRVSARQIAEWSMQHGCDIVGSCQLLEPFALCHSIAAVAVSLTATAPDALAMVASRTHAALA